MTAVDQATPLGLQVLSAAEAARRRAASGPNELPRSPEPTLARRIVHHLADPLSLVLLGAAFISIAVLDHIGEGTAIAAIVVLNVTIGVVQEHRAATAVAALEQLTAPTARVRRAEGSATIPAHDVVVGDVVELMAGDRVPADVCLSEAVSLAVDEAILTAEALPAEKQALAPVVPGAPPADRTCEVFAGTMVVRGHGIGTVLRTGAQSEVGKIARSLAGGTEPPLVAELRAVAGRMSGLALLLGAALIPIVAVRGRGDDDAVVTAVLAGVALAIAAVPEGLATVVTGALALGARRMARQGAIVRRLPAIEALGSATVICTDKTGTLTTGRLAVTDAVALPGRDAALWTAALRCNDSADGHGDPIDVALAVAAHAAGSAGRVGRRVRERPFDAESRSMATVHDLDGVRHLSVKGAPETVLGRCVAGPERDVLLDAVRELTAHGVRVLALAGAHADDLEASELEPLGVVGFRDPLRPSAIEAIADARRAGIRVVLVTGDHAVTARAVANEVGIDDGLVVSGPELASLSTDQRADALRRAAVVARVDPGTKVDLVTSHRAAGEVVAMTGDGVNDAPALRRADVGVALAGEGGTDVAREAAELVVTNGDLRTLVAAIREGRRIYRNLQAVVGYLVTGNLSEVLIVIATVLLLPELAVPLLPAQLLWVNLVTDGLPALALGVDRPASDPLADPPRTPGGHLLHGRQLWELTRRAGIITATVTASAFVGRRWGWDEDQIRTQILLSLLASHLLLAYTARAQRWAFETGWWRNRLLLFAVGGSLALQALAFGTRTGRSLLSLATLPPAGWMLTAAAALVALAVMDATRHPWEVDRATR